MNMWQFLDTPAPGAEQCRALVNWSMNYDTHTGTPWHVFLDLIGYSQEHYGTTLGLLKVGETIHLGYVELDYIGDALKEYATNPQAVEAWISALDDAEMNAYETA